MKTGILITRSDVLPPPSPIKFAVFVVLWIRLTGTSSPRILILCFLSCSSTTDAEIFYICGNIISYASNCRRAFHSTEVCLCRRSYCGYAFAVWARTCDARPFLHHGYRSLTAIGNRRTGKERMVYLWLLVLKREHQ